LMVVWGSLSGSGGRRGSRD